MFYKDPHEVYRVPELDELAWLVHGFGTRRAQTPANLTTLKQVHSSTCVFAAGRHGILGEGDALLENTPGVAVAVKTADCVPVLLVDRERRAVAAVHAGWRGTAAEIARRAVEEMQREFGSEPSGLEAAIGPGIGACCYEVGQDVGAHFPQNSEPGRDGRARVNLAGANRRQLLEAGLDSARIYISGLCTMCRPDEFHSYRRDKEDAGRMLSFVGLRRGAE